ncbi:uncharacterized protein BDR25DRAFT_105748 [Lindgomyces ingoldianus]|uniref:Uncharacterized protein n=1 Tax=Lindgomyces ingoldianus TaxID=673940 RepID=A0ACB6QCH5_9PLEO|nr:uncharacterized protein BDR25DRAFT_105748 [Lindgomyces ingoldianus]KAF2463851.1 hypothetical protein BDR25DRAFT_105748 [Lindgomyces ingoldianus]
MLMYYYVMCIWVSTTRSCATCYTTCSRQENCAGLPAGHAADTDGWRSLAGSAGVVRRRRGGREHKSGRRCGCGRSRQQSNVRRVAPALTHRQWNRQCPPDRASLENFGSVRDARIGIGKGLRKTAARRRRVLRSAKCNSDPIYPITQLQQLRVALL